MQNVVLVGLMGTGKSAVGKKLAREIGFQFFDTDRFIEDYAGRTIAEIWDEEGEAHFRQLETEAVQAAVSRNRRVIATGGGTVVCPENLDRLERYGALIWLCARPEVIYKRIQKSPGKRPLLNLPDPEMAIKTLLEKRAPYYQRAAFSVDTSDIRVAEVVVQIKNRILEIEADPHTG